MGSREERFERYSFGEFFGVLRSAQDDYQINGNHKKRGFVSDGEIEFIEEGVAVKCSHLDEVRKVKPSAKGCEECLKIGSKWVHLRMCLICGHVGCCDSSPHRHATRHFNATKHPIMRSIEPGESWGWCFIDQMEVDVV